MAHNPLTVGLACDFNVQNFAVLLQKSLGIDRAVSTIAAPFGQAYQVLHNQHDAFWATPMDTVVLWTFPALAVPSFQNVASFERFSLAELMAEVDAFAALVGRIPESVRTVVLPAWVAPG